MSRLIVTGGSGFVGANLVRRLLADSHDVHLLLRSEYASWRLEGVLERVRLHVVDLADYEKLNQTVSQIAPEWVFHLAAYGAYPDQTQVPTMVRTNVLGTVNLVEASIRAGAEVVINTGSSSEYGFRDGPPTESEPAEPNSAYAMTKLCATQLCRELALRRGALVVTLRPYSVYGPFEEPSRLIPTLVVQGLEGRLPPLADPRTCRDFVFVEDVVEAYVRTAAQAQPNQSAIFNVGSGVQSSIAEVVEMVRVILDITEEPQWGKYPDRTWDTQTWVSDSTRIRREVGWNPRFGLKEGLLAMVAWFNTHPEYLAHYQQSAPEVRR